MYLYLTSVAGHHHHPHDHFHPGNAPRARRNIRAAFLLNTFFAFIEIAGGLYTNSVAILSDALHDFGDSISLGLAYYFQKVSEKKGDARYSYGYGRFSLLGAFITSFILIGGSVLIITEAVDRFRHPSAADAGGMIILALVGVAVNFVAMLRLRSGSTVSERVLSLHFVEDVLGWLAVLIGGVVMLFADVPWLDPALSLAIAAYILINVFRNLRSVFRIVLQGVPAGVSEDKIRADLLKISGIREVDHFHIWTMDGIFNIVTLHVVVDGDLKVNETEELRREIRERLAQLKIDHATIELEACGSGKSSIC